MLMLKIKNYEKKRTQVEVSLFLALIPQTPVHHVGRDVWNS